MIGRAFPSAPLNLFHHSRETFAVSSNSCWNGPIPGHSAARRFCRFLSSCFEKPSLFFSNHCLLLRLFCFVAPRLCSLGVTLAKIQVGSNLLKKNPQKYQNVRAASDVIVGRLRADSKRRLIPPGEEKASPRKDWM